LSASRGVVTVTRAGLGVAPPVKGR
jgi:hypothetical protein